MEERQSPLKQFARSREMMSAMGLDPFMALSIAAIVIYAGNLEYHLEQAIWTLEGHKPLGVRHQADARQPTEHLERLYRLQHQAGTLAEKKFLRLWCGAAWHALECRHSIAHGVAVPIGSAISFIRNPRWQGEDRKRKPATFWSDAESLDYVEDVFATLLRYITMVSRGTALVDLATPENLRLLGTARSIAAEFSQAPKPPFDRNL